MATYTTLTHPDMTAIAAYYGLTVVNFKSIPGGAGNSSFKLNTPTSTYVVTVCDDKNFAEVMALVQLLDHLADHSFATTCVLRPTSGDIPILTYLNKPVFVKEFIVGNVRETPSETMLERVGQTLARLNQIPAPAGLPTQHPYGKAAFSNINSTALDGKSIDPKFETLLADYAQTLNQTLPDTLPRALIHGDLFYDNILYNEHGQPTIIDFEEACHDTRVFDIGMALMGNCATAGNDPTAASFSLPLAAALVRGYQQVQPLTAAEKNHLQEMTAYAAIATAYWRYWKYNIHDPDPAKATLHWRMVEIAEAVWAIDADEFLRAAVSHQP